MKTKIPQIPVFSKKLLRLCSHYRKEYDILFDLEELYNYKLKKDGKLRAGLWIWRQVLFSLINYLLFLFDGSFIMYKANLKIAFRNIKKHRGYSFINIAGLAVGMACCFFILLYIQFELSYDTYHRDTNRIYRIAWKNKSEMREGYSAATPLPLIPAIKENYSQVESAARISRYDDCLVTYGDKSFYENNFTYADEEIFNIFTIPFIYGDALTALQLPNSVVITENIAGKYFGNGNPVGKIINIEREDYTITGVVKNPPQNTHLKYNLIASIEGYRNIRRMSLWNGMYCYSYIKLGLNVNPDEFEQEICHLAHNFIGDNLEKRGITYTYFFQPLSDIHLHSHLMWEAETPGNPVYLYIFSVVCALVLLIACSNFINLTTARSAQRAKEVGLRKVVGANRFQLIRQFLSDSVLISLIAALLAFLIVCIAIEYFDYLIGFEFSISFLFKPLIILAFIGFVLFSGFAAGIYPAFFLSSFNPLMAIKGTSGIGNRRSFLRKALVVGQFAVSIILIICTVIVYSQLNFMKNRYLGFDKEQKLIIPVRDEASRLRSYETVKSEFLKNPSISGAAASSHIPGRLLSESRATMIYHINGKAISFDLLFIDHDFISVYDIKLAAGRTLKREMTSVTSHAILINETAAKARGFKTAEEAVGKKIEIYRSGEKEIIGVTKDFHVSGLKTEITPLIMINFRSPQSYRYLNLSVNTDGLRETLSSVERKWSELFPGVPLEYFFLDADFNSQYRAEEKLGKIFGIITFLGVFIASLGLFGLISFIAERRTKEIGIRKVLGGSSSGIVVLLLKDFAKWVILSNAIAWPIAYFAVNKWLHFFAYRIDIDFFIFILSGATALVIALLTVGYQSIKAAHANPVEALRFE